MTRLKNTRKLIYVPIVHTEADMGSMRDPIKDKYIDKYGQSKWSDHIKKINSMWEHIENKLLTLSLSYRHVTIYQDGLPNCGVEKKIVSEIAKNGSKNHQLIVKLLDKGARLVGTEDPKLLMEEYNAIRGALNQNNKSDKGLVDKYKGKAENNLYMRDKYISQRIDETLKEDETGILFIGLMHKVNEILPKDIKIDLFIHNLPFDK